MAGKKRVTIVGNGDLSRDLSADVDSSDFVVRFNEPKSSIGMSGTKTDWLFMANSGKPAERRYRDPDFTGSPIFQAAKELIFAYHPTIVAAYFKKPNLLSWIGGRRSDWTVPSIMRYGAAGKEIRIMPAKFYHDGCAELGLPPEKMHEIFPSTGYFGIWHVLQNFPADSWAVEVCGFGWKGWKRHAWADESAWVSRHVKSGRIVIFDSVG